MNGYSKIRDVSNTKSRSVDFSDLFSPPQISPHSPKSSAISNHSPTSKTQETKVTNDFNTKLPFTDDSFLEQKHEDGVAERFGVILSRNCSVSSTSSQRFRAGDKQNITLQSAVKRAFSLRKSSSISEGYSRIHDQSNSFFSPIDDDAPITMPTRSKKSRGKILKVCKRLFGF